MILNKKRKMIVYEEINGEFIPKCNKRKINIGTHSVILSSHIFSMIPNYAQAAELDPVTGNIHSTVMAGLDAMVVFIIIASGIFWMLGHRTKAIHLLISCCLGYLLARNAVAIRDLLKSV